jgi:hypothetical protein
MHGNDKIYIQNLVRKEKHLVNLGLDERKMLRCNVRRWNVKVWTRVTDSEG